ncbi:hypothetical protein [Dactylosporangium sp. NPDC000521]|uniref:hypothetical protein n=1 Tax=Dactylosporangium sp. NPDC000521 TaxID=3363975 RepID=UPI00367860DC
MFFSPPMRLLFWLLGGGIVSFWPAAVFGYLRLSECGLIIGHDLELDGFSPLCFAA